MATHACTGVYNILVISRVSEIEINIHIRFSVLYDALNNHLSLAPIIAW